MKIINYKTIFMAFDDDKSGNILYINKIMFKFNQDFQMLKKYEKCLN